MTLSRRVERGREGITPLEWVFSLSWNILRTLDERHLEVGGEIAATATPPPHTTSTATTTPRTTSTTTTGPRSSGCEELTAGSILKVRRQFEKAVASGMGRRSSLIWRLYLAFEVSGLGVGEQDK